jgi:hemoglobin-like flavoprotein
MTPTNLNIIRRPWSLAALNKMQVTLIFYANLFRITPNTEVLFKNDLTSQATKLMDTLTFIVDHPDEPEALLPAARDLELQEVTIKLHVKTLCRKLNTTNCTHAAIMAKEAGLF